MTQEQVSARRDAERCELVAKALQVLAKALRANAVRGEFQEALTMRAQYGGLIATTIASILIDPNIKLVVDQPEPARDSFEDYVAQMERIKL